MDTTVWIDDSWSVKAPTEEFLYLLLWTAEMLTRPTWRTMNGSFESWAYGSGFLRRIHELEERKIVEQRADPRSRERVVRLTELGRRIALGGIDPLERWNRAWDGRWRLVFFDLPESERPVRLHLRRTLRHLGFGCLQKSVWISPDPAETIRDLVAGSKVEAKLMTVFEGHPAGGETDQDLVAAAWDFSEIAKLYATWARVADDVPTLKPGRPLDAARLRTWAAKERSAWQQIASTDPFLPAKLLPADYPGRKAWERRTALFGVLGAFLKTANL